MLLSIVSGLICLVLEKRTKAGELITFLVSKKIIKKIKKSDIMTTIMGSDHAPVILEI